MQELVNADAKVVFKMMLGQREAAIADLRRFAEIGFRQDAVNLAKRLNIPARKVLSKKNGGENRKRG